MEQELRRMFEIKETEMIVSPTLSPELRNRIGRQRMVTGALVAAAALALVVGGFAGARSLSRDEALPPVKPDSKETAKSSGGMWSQSSLEEVREAQRLADEGDPRYTWQVFRDWPPYYAMEPAEADIFVRFVKEELGWEEFSWGVGPGLYPPEDWPWQFVVVRCAPDGTNPMYSNDPDGRGCAPTIDEHRYETVRISGDMPVRVDDPSGIWVVKSWTTLQPSAASVTSINDFYRHQIEQVEPPSNAEATEFLSTFLQARVDGEGAEEYLHAPADGEIPLLYATTSDAPYERFEFELVQGPVWPSGWMEFEVRLFAEGGVIVEQPFFVDRDDDGRLVLEYGTLEDQEVPTTENGAPVAEPFEFVNGDVTLYATDRWEESFFYWGLGLDSDFDLRLELVGNPRPVETSCRPGPAPADAEALARAIRSDPDLAATAPVTVTVGGIDALRMEVTAAPGARACAERQLPEVLKGNDLYWSGLAPKQGIRMRLYLLDLPEGLSARILALAIAAPEDRFETVAEAAAPIVDSIEFDAP